MSVDLGWLGDAARSGAAYVVALATAIALGCTTTVEVGGGHGGALPCAVDADCDDQNPCTADACDGRELCAWTPLDGVSSPAQTPGDCQVVRCVAGEPENEPDDTDIPDGHQSCVIDACHAGEPTHTAKVDGVACDVVGEIGVCKNGICLAADACSSPGPCVTSTLDPATGTCVLVPLSDGTPTPGVQQPIGDCKVSLCVGGQPTDVPDDSDVPVTATECDFEVCESGVPSNPPTPMGTPCSTFMGNHPGFCDGAGACVECTTDEACSGPDPSDTCQHRSCVGHACGSYPANTTPAPSQFQTSGDCQKVVCDGMGGHSVTLDATDPMNDGSPCTIDACSGTVTIHTPAPPGTPCGPGGALCGPSLDCGCLSDAECTPPNTCGGGPPHVCSCTPKSCAQVGATCGVVPNGCFATLNCDDGVQNGGESDIDCGGAGTCAKRCAAGKKCNTGADCASQVCNTTCQ
jgi:hypothetical protein